MAKNEAFSSPSSPPYPQFFQFNQTTIHPSLSQCLFTFSYQYVFTLGNSFFFVTPPLPKFTTQIKKPPNPKILKTQNIFEFCSPLPLSLSFWGRGVGMEEWRLDLEKINKQISITEKKISFIPSPPHQTPGDMKKKQFPFSSFPPPLYQYSRTLFFQNPLSSPPPPQTRPLGACCFCTFPSLHPTSSSFRYQLPPLLALRGGCEPCKEGISVG